MCVVCCYFVCRFTVGGFCCGWVGRVASWIKGSRARELGNSLPEVDGCGLIVWCVVCIVPPLQWSGGSSGEMTDCKGYYFNVGVVSIDI